MEQKGWNTFNRLAFATGYVPGQSKEEMFKEDIAQPILGLEPDGAAISALRQLFIEAYATSLDE
eukprot:3787271-Amphidinium_carterae.1